MNNLKPYLVFVFIFSLLQLLKAQENFISQESDVPPYELPKLLISNAGKNITNFDEWNNIRRPEVLSLLETEMYGITPKMEVKISSGLRPMSWIF